MVHSTASRAPYKGNKKVKQRLEIRVTMKCQSFAAGKGLIRFNEDYSVFLHFKASKKSPCIYIYVNIHEIYKYFLLKPLLPPPKGAVGVSFTHKNY